MASKVKAQRNMPRKREPKKPHAHQQCTPVPEAEPTPKPSSTESTDVEHAKKNARTRAGRRFSMGLEPEVDVFDEVWALIAEREARRRVSVWGHNAEDMRDYDEAGKRVVEWLANVR
ncbi:uncharacterized protein MYCFIDRAFT_81057 [Pseudocercospora fijiensis CIRAD86]|uniref:Uncharacterized protein n=1 Tax=Pseudocercospora fijiensis (strain CIRAD86) TaxID=383855 RepID=M2ZKE7_PSEFD|nr:uncharacterized protein MYCFIDRAFT_81057 [Pseudocercospora fijiensis CIRAD86]EME79564.1 hypothetical protein MYCFIDRAFT_81057 [Pseudocercospora fijiensis CIRAD86]